MYALRFACCQRCDVRISLVLQQVLVWLQRVCDNCEVYYSHVKQHGYEFPEGKNVPGGCKCKWEGMLMAVLRTRCCAELWSVIEYFKVVSRKRSNLHVAAPVHSVFLLKYSPCTIAAKDEISLVHVNLCTRSCCVKFLYTCMLFQNLLVHTSYNEVVEVMRFYLRSCRVRSDDEVSV